MAVTTHRNYPLLDVSKSERSGAARIISALAMIDSDVAQLLAAMSLKADAASIGPAIANAIDAFAAGAPAALDTFAEVAAKLADNDDAVAAIFASLATKANAANVYSRATLDGMFADTAEAIRLGGVQIGQTILWNNDEAIPEGFLKENGAEYSRTVYHELFAAIGTKHGAGDGSTTFNVPESRGEFVRGHDDGRGVDPDRDIGSWQDSENKSHTHGINDPGHRHQHYAGDGGGSVNINVTKVTANNHPNYTLNATTGITIKAAGGDEARSRNVTKLFLIRAY